jgi:hypothetical protein
VLVGMLVPIMLTVHFMIRDIISVTSLTLHKAATRTYTNKGSQWHEQSTVVHFVSHAGKGQETTQWSPGVAINNHQLMPTSSSCSKP